MRVVPPHDETAGVNPLRTAAAPERVKTRVVVVRNLVRLDDDVLPSPAEPHAAVVVDAVAAGDRVGQGVNTGEVVPPDLAVFHDPPVPELDGGALRGVGVAYFSTTRFRSVTFDAPPLNATPVTLVSMVFPVGLSPM
jgi:hypothetical protein